MGIKKASYKTNLNGKVGIKESNLGIFLCDGFSRQAFATVLVGRSGVVAVVVVVRGALWVGCGGGGGG